MTEVAENEIYQEFEDFKEFVFRWASRGRNPKMSPEDAVGVIYFHPYFDDIRGTDADRSIDAL